MKTYTVYADGGCRDNGTPEGKGSYGIVINYGQPDQVTLSGVVPVTPCTNNIAELYAFIVAMAEIAAITTEKVDITVYTDSNYLVQGYNQWLRGWIAKDYRTSTGAPVANTDLWKRINKIKELANPKLIHVKGHAGNQGNELADQLASQALKNNCEEPKLSKETQLRNLLMSVVEMLNESEVADMSEDVTTITEYIKMKLSEI